MPRNWDEIPSITIPEDQFEENGYPSEDGRSRLIAALRINGVLHHIDAIATRVQGDMFVADDMHWDDELSHLYAAVHADGHMETVSIKGREYALVISPFCK